MQSDSRIKSSASRAAAGHRQVYAQGCSSWGLHMSKAHALRQLAKAIVPARVLTKAAATRDWLRLSTLPELSFDWRHLRCATALRPTVFFGSVGISQSWEMDY